MTSPVGALTPEEINVLWRGIPESPGYHEIDWNQSEIDAANAAIAKLKSLSAGVSREDVALLTRLCLAAKDLSRNDFVAADHLAARLTWSMLQEDPPLAPQPNWFIRWYVRWHPWSIVIAWLACFLATYSLLMLIAFAL